MKTSYKLVILLALITASCAVNNTHRPGKLESTAHQSNTNLNRNLSDGMPQEKVHIQWGAPVGGVSNLSQLPEVPIEIRSIFGTFAGTNVIVHRDSLRNSSVIIAKSVIGQPMYYLQGLQTTNWTRFELVMVDTRMKSGGEFIGFREAYDSEKKKFSVTHPNKGRSVAVPFDASYLVSHVEEGLHFKLNGNGGALEVNVISEYVQGFVSKAKEHGFLPK